jgi:hypothetical protein
MSKNSFVAARKALKELNGALSDLFGQVADSITVPIEHMLDVEEQRPVQAATSFEEKKALAEETQKRAIETAKANSEERRNRQGEFKKHGLKIYSDDAPEGEAPETSAPLSLQVNAPKEDAPETSAGTPAAPLSLQEEAPKEDAPETSAGTPAAPLSLQEEAPKEDAPKAKAPKAKAEKKAETPKVTETGQEALV